ncbi:hypothetical protein APY03_1690 [Variovorax sp. WDL1]|nr:hypothetical protein APY03_1690 [Variovorax sp. WDL1]
MWLHCRHRQRWADRSRCRGRQQCELLLHDLHQLRLLRNDLLQEDAVAARQSGDGRAGQSLDGHCRRRSLRRGRGRCNRGSHRSRRGDGDNRVVWEVRVEEFRQRVKAAIAFHQLPEAQVHLELFLDLDGNLRQREGVKTNLDEARSGRNVGHVHAREALEQLAQAHDEGSAACGLSCSDGCHCYLRYRIRKRRGGRGSGRGRWDCLGGGNVDPKTLALERIGRQQHAMFFCALVERDEIDVGAHRPEASGGKPPGAAFAVGLVAEQFDGRCRNRLGCVLANQRRQGIAGAGFDKHGVGDFCQHRSKRCREAHGFPQVAGPVVRIGRFLRLQEGAGQRRIDWQSRRRQPDATHQRFERGHCILHHGRVERVRCLQQLGRDAVGFESDAQTFDGIERTRRDASRRPVFGRQRDVGTEARLEFGGRQAHREHRAGRLGLHQRTALCDESRSVFELHDAGQRGGGKFTDAVTHERHRLQAQGENLARNRIFQNKDGRLGDRGRGQGRIICGEHSLAQVEGEHAVEGGDAFVECRTKHRIGQVQRLAHSGVLRALTREHQYRLWHPGRGCPGGGSRCVLCAQCGGRLDG